MELHLWTNSFLTFTLTMGIYPRTFEEDLRLTLTAAKLKPDYIHHAGQGILEWFNQDFFQAHTAPSVPTYPEGRANADVIMIATVLGDAGFTPSRVSYDIYYPVIKSLTRKHRVIFMSGPYLDGDESIFTNYRASIETLHTSLFPDLVTLGVPIFDVYSWARDNLTEEQRTVVVNHPNTDYQHLIFDYVYPLLVAELQKGVTGGRLDDLP